VNWAYANSSREDTSGYLLNATHLLLVLMILLLGDILFLYYFQLYIPLISSSKSSGHFNVFVGDLSPEVTDATLFACFSVYTTCS